MLLYVRPSLSFFINSSALFSFFPIRNVYSLLKSVVYIRTTFHIDFLHCFFFHSIFIFLIFLSFSHNISVQFSYFTRRIQLVIDHFTHIPSKYVDFHCFSDICCQKTKGKNQIVILCRLYFSCKVYDFVTLRVFFFFLSFVLYFLNAINFSNATEE